MNLSVLYRGPLTSCNYQCSYCPFAKRVETKAQLQRDRAALKSLTEWLEAESSHRFKILFTPWGEALVRAWYREAVAALTHVAHIESVVIQTNLSCSLEWLGSCRSERLALWATYHPTETTREAFVEKVERVRALGVRISAGTVGVPESLEQIQILRERLPQSVYLWINAQQPRRRSYTREELEAFTAIDPHFPVTARRARSLGRPCQAGEISFTVDGAGHMRRCHFVDEVIGSIHDPAWLTALRPRPCPNRFCDCFLGKAQLEQQSLTPFFGDTLLERIALGYR